MCGSKRLTTLPGEARVAAEHAGPSLCHHASDQFDRGRQALGALALSRLGQRTVGLAQDGASDPEQFSVELLHVILPRFRGHCGSHENAVGGLNSPHSTIPTVSSSTVVPPCHVRGAFCTVPYT